jgi:hypothetical protein
VSSASIRATIAAWGSLSCAAELSELAGGAVATGGTLVAAWATARSANPTSSDAKGQIERMASSRKVVRRNETYQSHSNAGETPAPS